MGGNLKTGFVFYKSVEIVSQLSFPNVSDCFKVPKIFRIFQSSWKIAGCFYNIPEISNMFQKFLEV